MEREKQMTTELEGRYRMALEAIFTACASGEGPGSWLNAAYAMRDIAKVALRPPPIKVDIGDGAE